MHGDLCQNWEEWFEYCSIEARRTTPVPSPSLSVAGSSREGGSRPGTPTTTSSTSSRYTGFSEESSASTSTLSFESFGSEKEKKKKRSAKKKFCISILKLVPGIIVEMVLEKMHILKPER